ncbi:DMT family transporter [Ancylobacter mangrovi]|uniref:DMT family transporter n=1 Tax=Ancylobacter mangrovi TaxID=2972472 RepID=UPI00216111DD|nr:DMT family transporter [Ancylobacter mangrovi]MCS0504255.1 DMT family transporter [Ancylobacter mangrovi]
MNADDALPRDREAGTSARAPRLSRSLLIGFGWAALTVTIFSGWFVVTRFSVTRELRIWDITALRFGIGAVLLAPAVLRPGRGLPLAAWGEGLVFMLLWGVPFVLLVALGLRLTTAAQAASITPALMPVFAGVFAWTFLRERQGRARWVGYGAIVAGMAALVAAGAAVHGAPSPAGLGALALAAAMWATYTLLYRRSGLNPIQSAALICVWSAVLFLPAYWLLGLSRFSDASAGEIALQVVYQGVLMSGVAIITFNRSVALLGSSAATAIIALLPAVASLLAVPILGEVPSLPEAAAIAVIVAGVLLAARPTPDRRTSPST